MRRAFTISAFVLSWLGCILSFQGTPVAAQPMQPMMFGTPDMQNRRSELLHKVLPSVVNITTRVNAVRRNTGTNAAGSMAAVTGLYGSGFVIDTSGVIATNYHVVKDAWEIDVTFYDGTRVPAHLLNATRLIDVALIKVDVGHPLPALRWGDSDTLQVGDPVFAIGNALGVGISVSGGLVSALNRNIMESPYDDFIQTDAAINHGNSGGPMVDTNGDVVGIDSAIISLTDSSSGVGFAISAHSAQVVIKRLMNYGWLRPGWIGVKVQQLTTDMSLALGMPQAEGSIVAAVTPGGPAAEAGLRVGDVIRRVGDAAPTDERALLRTIATTSIGRTIALGLWRDGKAQRVDVPVKEWPRNQWAAIDGPVTMAAAHDHVPPDLGIALETLDGANRARYGVGLARTGVLVTDVAAGTDAARRGLAPGDLIVRVQEKPVLSATEVRAAFDVARAQKRPFVLVLVEPGVTKRSEAEWVALRLSDT